jgi:hypothetical protein
VTGRLANWIVDRKSPEKTRARILALVLALVPLIMAGVLAYLAP